MRYVLLLIILIPFAVFSQDQLFHKNGKVEEVNITEIGPSEIKYTKPNGEGSLVVSILRDDLTRIIFSNGDIMVMMDDLKNPDIYADQKQKAIKMEFIAPLLGNLSFTYEQSLRPGMSFEIGANFIGVGRKPEERDPNGFGGKVGMKLIRTPDFKSGSMRYMHVLQGFYVRPEFVYAFFTDSYKSENSNLSKVAGVNYGIVMLNIGKEWVFQDVFVIDIYGGAGYGAVSIPSDYDPGYYYGYAGTNESWRPAFSGGFRIGFLIN